MIGFRDRMTLVSTVLVTGCLAAPAMADEGSAGDRAALEEIVVTAQKRTERLQDVPVAVSTVQTDTLLQENLVQLRDHYSRIPGLSIGGGGTEQRANSLAIRGITTGGGTAATVAITVDDVPFTSSSFLAQSPLPDLDPASLERIEVLRGPQGTLYGASSLGGLLKYVTAAPDTHTVSARVEAEGNRVVDGDNGWSLRGSGNLPLIEDKLAIRASAFTRHDPGYIDNINPLVNASDINSNSTEGGRIALFAQPLEQLTLNFSAMRQHSHLFGSPSLQVCERCWAGPYSFREDYTPRFGDFVSNLGPTFRQTSFSLYTGRANLDLGSFDVTSISSYGRYSSASDLDTTNIFGFLLPVYGGDAASTPLINADLTKKFTQEVRLASKQNDRFEWLLGGFYTHEDIAVTQIINVQSSTGAQIAAALDSVAPSTFKETAVFGDATYHFTKEFDVQVGVRHSSDKQTTGGFTHIDALAQPIFGPDTTTTNAGSSESSTTWLVTPRYRFSRDLMAYVRVATGYRPGGPNAVLANIPPTFQSDKVINYELGIKGTVPDALLTYEADVFQVNWDRVQLQANNISNQISYFTNGRTARSRGFELTTGWRPLHGLSIDANATFTDAVLTADVPQPPGASTLIGFSGDRLPQTAKFVGNLAATQSWDVGRDMTVYVGADLTYVGSRLGDLPNVLPPDPAAYGYRLQIPSYSLTDARTGLTKGPWSMNVYIRNLFDKRAVLEATTRGSTGAPTAVFAQPRTYGIAFTGSF